MVGRLVNNVENLGAFSLNAVSAVLIVSVNKVLMNPHYGFGFTFATTLCSLHFFFSAVYVWSVLCCGSESPTTMPVRDALTLSTVTATSVASLNLSLLMNSVGFYQITKILIAPCVCFLEFMFLDKHFSNMTLLSIVTVIIGVAVVTVSDVTLNSFGLVIATISIASSCVQQVLVGVLQKRHTLSPNQLMSLTAPVQGAILLLAGPFIDHAVSGQWVIHYQGSADAYKCLLASCCIAVLINVSQFMCLGRFGATTFQVLGHIKTVMVLLVGWLYFGEKFTVRKGVGIVLALAGMLAYGYFHSKPTNTCNGSAASLESGGKDAEQASSMLLLGYANDNSCGIQVDKHVVQGDTACKTLHTQHAPTTTL